MEKSKTHKNSSNTQIHLQQSKSKSKHIKKKLKTAVEKQVSRSHYCHWSQSEQKNYVKFLITRRKLFDLSIGRRKRTKIHSKMANCIKARSRDQCRSHHQKMISKYGSVEAIIKQFSYLFPDLQIEKHEEKGSLDVNENVKQQINSKEIQVLEAEVKIEVDSSSIKYKQIDHKGQIKMENKDLLITEGIQTSYYHHHFNPYYYPPFHQPYSYYPPHLFMY